MKNANLFKDAFMMMLEADLNLDLADNIENTLRNDDKPRRSRKPSFEDVAFKDSLDNDVSPEDYLTDPAADKALQQKIDNRNQEVASVIEGWTVKIDEFTDFLNGTEDSSLQSILAKAQPGTLFAKVQSSNSRKLANAAQELASLSQSLKSFIGQKAITQG